jgi:hypothetical protein
MIRVQKSSKFCVRIDEASNLTAIFREVRRQRRLRRAPLAQTIGKICQQRRYAVDQAVAWCARAAMQQQWWATHSPRFVITVILSATLEL